MYYYYILPSEMEASSYRSPKTCFASVLLLSVLYCLILGWLARVWRRRQDSQAMVLPKPGMQSNLYRFRLNCNNCLSTYFNQHNIKSLKIEKKIFMNFILLKRFKRFIEVWFRKLYKIGWWKMVDQAHSTLHCNVLWACTLAITLLYGKVNGP